MNLTVPRIDLARELAVADQIARRKSTIPVLNTIHLRASNETGLTVTATDLDVSYRSTIAAEVVGEGAALAQRTLVGAAKGLADGSLALSLNGTGRLAVRCGAFFGELATLPVDEYPAWPAVDGKSVDLPREIVSQILARVAFAGSVSDTRWMLDGVRVEMESGLVRMVKTDGHRLAVAEAESGAVGPEWTCLIPHGAIPLLQSLLEDDRADRVTLTVGEQAMSWTVGPSTLQARLVHGTYPEWRRIVPTGPRPTTTVDREALLKVLRLVAPFGERDGSGTATAGRHSVVKLRAAGGSLEVSARAARADGGQAEEAIEAEHDGAAGEALFNGRYLIDALEPMTSERVTVSLVDDVTQALVTEAESPVSFRVVVMPMRI